MVPTQPTLRSQTPWTLKGVAPMADRVLRGESPPGLVKAVLQPTWRHARSAVPHRQRREFEVPFADDAENPPAPGCANDRLRSRATLGRRLSRPGRTGTCCWAPFHRDCLRSASSSFGHVGAADPGTPCSGGTCRSCAMRWSEARRARPRCQQAELCQLTHRYLDPLVLDTPGSRSVSVNLVGPTDRYFCVRQE